MRDIERGGEQNNIEKQRIIADFINRLIKVKALSEEIDSTDISNEMIAKADEALISDITEYGRMTHAEMSAICDAARTGRSLLGTTIFVTTFPCHNCAKHIIASGIERVIFVEPYPKSKAFSSHSDAVSSSKTCEGKVVFEHFEGIAPARYVDIFRKENKRRNGSNISEWYEGEPAPRLKNRGMLHSSREKTAIKAVLSKLKPSTGK